MAQDNLFADQQIPPELLPDIQEAQRKQAVAQALANRYMQPLQSQTAGRFVVPISPLRGLAQIAGAGLAGNMMEQQNQAQADLARRYGAMQAAEIERIGKLRSGVPGEAPPAELGGGPPTQGIPGSPRQAVFEAMTSNFPRVQKIGEVWQKSDEAALAREENNLARLENTKLQLESNMTIAGTNAQARKDIADKHDQVLKEIAAGHDRVRQLLANSKQPASQTVPSEQVNVDFTKPQGRMYLNQHKEDLGQARMAASIANDLTKSIDDLLADKNFGYLFGRGYLGTASQYFAPGAMKKLDHIRAIMKGSGMAQLKTASGQSIGAMQVAEWPIVEQQIGSIGSTMNEKDARDALNAVKAKVRDVSGNVLNTYNDTWSRFPQLYKKVPADFLNDNVPNQLPESAPADPPPVSGNTGTFLGFKPAP